jgi:hypothetical protein
MQNGMGGISGEPHSGADRCILYDGKRPFRNGVGREGVRDACEEDGEVELVSGFWSVLVGAFCEFLVSIL